MTFSIIMGKPMLIFFREPAFCFLTLLLPAVQASCIRAKKYRELLEITERKNRQTEVLKKLQSERVATLRLLRDSVERLMNIRP